LECDSSNNIFNKVVTVTSYYLGNVSEKFISSQAREHLNKDPHDLTRSDLSELMVWLRVTTSLLIEDPVKVDKYMGDLEKLLVNNNHPEKVKI